MRAHAASRRAALPATRPAARTNRPRAHGTALAAVALALICALALAACGEKKDTIAPAATKPFTVMLDYFPNADHAPLYAAIANGDFKAGGPGSEARDPGEPRRTAAAAGGGEGGHGDQLRAGSADRARPGAEGGLDRRARAAAADIHHRAAKPAHHDGGAAEGQEGRHGRDPLPGGGAEDRAAERGREPEQRAGSQRGLQPRAGDALGQGERDARRVLELRGDPAGTAAQAPDDDPSGPGGRAELQRAGAGGARRRGAHARAGPAGVPAGAHARRARGARQPGGGGEADHGGEPEPRTEAAAGIDPAHAPGDTPQRRERERALRLAGPQRRGRRSAAGCWRTGCCTANPDATGLPPFTNEYLPGQGL